MEDAESFEVLFRPSKRRKTLRQPATSARDIESQDAKAATTESPVQAAGEEQAGVVVARKRTGTGRTGISFSSNARREVSTEPNKGRALVNKEESGTLHIPGSDRFVRPSGRVGPTEDRHMMAYVDSKLAKPRSAVETSNLTGPSTEAVDSTTPNEGGQDATIDNGSIIVQSLESPRRTTSTAVRTYQPAQARSHKSYRRPTRRRGEPTRKEEDMVRDSMIEQIMGEGQVPHYEHETEGAGRIDNLASDMDDVDHDAAAADAFKAQLLADMELNNRRRRLPATKASAAVSAGPKLGGSRSQREKMKALEEAKVKK